MDKHAAKKGIPTGTVLAITIVVALIVAIVVAAGVFFWLRNSWGSTLNERNKILYANMVQPPEASKSDDFVQKMASWKEYKSKDGAFSFKYPENWIVSDDSSNGTIILQTPAEAKADRSSTLGCESFTISADSIPLALNSDDPFDSLRQLEISGQINNLQALADAFNAPASFYVDPTVCEHYSWHVSSGLGTGYLLKVMTPSELFNSKSVLTPDDYRDEINVVHSFKLGS